MSRILFLPDEKTVETEHNETIYGAALHGGIPLAHVCGGKGRCSTCRVLVLEGSEHCSPRSKAESAMASRLAFSPDIRLACQTTAAGDVKVRRLVLDDEDVELTNLLVKDAEPGLVGVEKHVLVLFADIRGFTPFSETLLPYDVIHVLNRYFNIMGHVISSHGGRIDNYMGDGLMAIFEADDPVEGTLGAVKAGLGMLEALRDHMHPYLERIWGKRFQIGIGLHYGLVGVGTVGALGDRRKKVIGDAVNLASRIESMNKKAGTQFLVSEDAYALVAEHVKINRTMKVKIRGKTGKYRLYEVVGLTDEAFRIGATQDTP